jgi:AbiTii/TIR domain
MLSRFVAILRRTFGVEARMNPLVERLQEDALNVRISSADLLRKAKRCAAHAGDAKSTAWIDHELNGYPGGVELPEYRRLTGSPQYKAAYGGWIPLRFEDGGLNETISWALLGHSIAEIDHLLTYDHPVVAYRPEQAQLLRPLIPVPFTDAGVQVGKGSLIGLLDAVRSRVSDWANEVEVREKVRTDKPRSLDLPSTKVSGEHSMKIFVSHSGVDQKVAAAFVELIRDALRLSAKDIRCTSVNGYKLAAGTNADEQLRREVFEAEAFVALLSPESLRSIYVMFELGARWGAKGHLLPVMIGGLDPSYLKPPLSAIHAVAGTSESDLHQLLETLAEKLGVVAESPAVYLKSLQSFAREARPAISDVDLLSR